MFWEKDISGIVFVLLVVKIDRVEILSIVKITFTSQGSKDYSLSLLLFFPGGRT